MNCVFYLITLLYVIVNIIEGSRAHSDKANKDAYYPPQTDPDPSYVYDTIDLSSPLVMRIGFILALLLTCNIIFMCYINCCSKSHQTQTSKRVRYSKVKHINSEDFSDSDAQQLNV